MKNARLLAHKLCNEYSAKVNGTKLPKLNPLLIRDSKDESCTLSYHAGILKIEAGCPIGAVYALSQAKAGSQSKHLAEILGTKTPRFYLRPLWILGEVNPFNDLSKQHEACRRLLELGYNAVILDRSIQSNTVSLLHDYGIKIIFKPMKITESFLSVKYQHDLKNLLEDYLSNGIDYIFWESGLYSQELEEDPLTRELTQEDLAHYEMKLLEETIAQNAGLIYYISTPDLYNADKQAKWMPRLCHDAGKKTIIAFSAFAGNPDEDHLPMHPFWETLRLSPDTLETPLLPILNGGNVNQGEGLWPILSLDLLNRFFTQMDRHRFAGAAIMTRTLPGRSGFLECNLWVAGRMMWESRSSYLYAETWCEAFRPDLNIKKFGAIFEIARRISVDLSILRAVLQGKYVEPAEECRARAESSLGQLNYLVAIFSKVKGEEQAGVPFLADYVRYFERDARRIIMHALQSMNISLPNLMSGIDAHESFWTKLLESPGSGIRGAAKVALLELPNQGLQDVKMPMIYREIML